MVKAISGLNKQPQRKENIPILQLNYFGFFLPIVHDKNYPILSKSSGGHSINQPFNLLKQTILIHNSKRNIYYCDFVRIRYSSP